MKFREENHAVLDAYPKQGNEPHTGRNAEIHPGKVQRDDAPYEREGDIRQYQQRVLHITEKYEQEEKYPEQTYRNHLPQPLCGTLLIFELPRPSHPVPLRDFDFRDLFLRLCDGAAQVAVADGELDTDVPFSIIPIDKGSAILPADVADFPQGDEASLCLLYTSDAADE